jgi:hypothetical protein
MIPLADRGKSVLLADEAALYRAVDEGHHFALLVNPFCLTLE